MLCVNCKYNSICAAQQETLKRFPNPKINYCHRFTPNDQEKKPMTNGDRIRAMSDEELAEFNNFCPHINEECTMKGCNACILDWLKQPAEVEL